MIHRSFYILCAIQAAVLLQDFSPPETKSILSRSKRDLTAYNVSFYLYNYAVNSSLLDFNDINFSAPFVFFIHGWSSSALTNTDIPKIAEAYLNKSDYNVIAVDWAAEADAGYIRAVEYAKSVGYDVAELIYTLYTNYSVSLDDFHVTGQSLGAHVAGFAGRTVQNLTGGLKVPKITAMDAAGPLYSEFWVEEDDRLNPEDAELVVAIHTDGGEAGLLQPYGTIDFYVNGGIPPQPGCPVLIGGSCSHGRSVEIFIESVQDSEAFLSKQCSSYVAYLLGQCADNESATIGGNLTTADAGVYYLTTNAEYPYSQS